MKFIKQIAAVGTGIAMLGATMTGALAADLGTLPEPFVASDAYVNVAMVIGAGSDDADARSTIQTYMNGLATATTVSGDGDSYKFEKTSTKFHLGDNVTEVITSSLDDDELPELLVSGKFIDNDNDEFDYTQKIEIGVSVEVSMFDDNDYKADSPTLGVRIASGENVLNYTLDFSDEPLVMDLSTSNFPFMGDDYYVLSNSTSSTNLVLTLLDSAEDTILSEGESSTLVSGGVSYLSSVDYISATEVKLTVNGEITNSLQEGETYKLSDEAYVGIKDIMYDSRDSGISKVEFSIGSGKLTLTGGSEIKLNDESISGLSAYFTNSTGAWTSSTGKLTNMVIEWNADEDLFITEDTMITMPGFGAVSMSYDGLVYPVEESILVQQGGDLYATLEDFPLKSGVADINFLYATTSEAFAGFGKDANNRLVTAADGAALTFDASTDDYFVASWTDDSDAESYLMKATNFVIDGSNNKTDFQYYKDGSWVDAKTGAKDADTFSVGNVDLSVTTVAKAGSTRTVVLTNNSANTNFNELWSKEGFKVQLPFLAANTSAAPGAVNFTDAGAGVGHNATSFYLVTNEEDKNGNKAHADGDQINLTIGWDSSTTPEVEVSTYSTEVADVTAVEIGNTDIWRDFTYSALATEILESKPSSGQNSVELIYHGDEVSAGVYISSSAATTESTSAAILDDSQVTTAADYNLILVGGPCVNSLTASFEGVGAGSCGLDSGYSENVGYLKMFENGDNVAMVVAGWSVDDTKRAAVVAANPSAFALSGKELVSVSGTGLTVDAISVE